MVKYFSWYALESGLRLVSSLVTSLIIARGLTVNDAGQYYFIISLITILQPIVHFGLDEYAYQQFVKYKNRFSYLSKLLSSIFFIKLLIAMCIMLIVFFMFIVNEQHEIYTLLLVTSFSLLFSSCTTWAIYINARGRGYINSIVFVFTVVIFTSIRLLLLLYGKSNSIESYLLVYIAELFFQFIVLVTILRKYISLNRVSMNYIMPLLARIYPMAISGVAIVIYYRVDQIMLGFMSGYDDVAVYAVQSQLLISATFLIQIIINGTYPYWFSNGRINDEMVVGILKIVTIICLSIWLFSYFFMKDIVSFFWGESFSLSADLLLYSVWGALFAGIGAATSKVMLHEKLQHSKMKRVIGSMVINIILNALSIPYIGLWGAVLSTVVAQVYSGIVGDLLSRKTRRFFFLNIKAFNIISVYGYKAIVKR